MDEIKKIAQEYGEAFYKAYSLLLDCVDENDSSRINLTHLARYGKIAKLEHSRIILQEKYETFASMLSSNLPFRDRFLFFSQIKACVPDCVFWNKINQRFRYNKAVAAGAIEFLVTDSGVFVEAIALLETFYNAMGWYRFLDDSIDFEFNDVELDKLKMQLNQLPQGERLTLAGVLKLELFDFFDYCRDGAGANKLYIHKYLDQYSDGFNPEQVRLIWREFEVYFQMEKDSFYSDTERIERALEFCEYTGKEIPLYPDVEYTPPERAAGMDEDEHNRHCELSKNTHDFFRGKVNVEKLLSYDSLDLWGLYVVERILKEKMNIPTTAKDNAPDDEFTLDKSNSISRDALRFLFVELMRKGVINDMADTALSGVIGEITGFSADQIRKNFRSELSPSSKQNLKEFLEGVIKKL